jgi:hypothetical protein
VTWGWGWVEGAWPRIRLSGFAGLESSAAWRGCRLGCRVASRGTRVWVAGVIAVHTKQLRELWACCFTDERDASGVQVGASAEWEAVSGAVDAA